MERKRFGFVVALLAILLTVGLPAEAQKFRNKSSKKLLGDGSEVAAKAGAAPQSQVVEPAFIPADSALPTFYVTVEPNFVVAAQGIVSGGGVISEAQEQSSFTSAWLVAVRTHSPQSMSPSASPNEMLGYGAAAQLVTALLQVGNVAVIDYPIYQADPNRYPGIFMIKGTVTEYTETNDFSQKKKGWSTVVPGVIANVVGNVADIPVLEEGGRVAAMVNGGKKTITTKRTGMVGLSLQIVQVNTGRIVGAPTCQGTFVTENATQLKHGLGIESSQAEYQASALDQAGQAALNDAVTKIWEVLKRQTVSTATNNVVAMLPPGESK